MLNPNRSKECLSSRSTLLLAFVLLAVACGLALGAQSTGEKGGPGFDFFRTEPGTSFSFSDDFAIPSGFFSESSGRFTGTVHFTGEPLGSFQNHKPVEADTVIKRKTTPTTVAKYPSESKVEIEIVALSLKSTQPIKVHAGGKTELWDVKVRLSPSHPSTGSMTFVQSSAKGGLATSEFTVYPLFTFVRQGDKAEKTLDTGTQKLAAKGRQHVTLKASNIPWERTSPTATAKLNNGIAVDVGGTVIIHSNTSHSHLTVGVAVEF